MEAIFWFSLGAGFILAFEFLVNLYIKKHIIERQKERWDKLEESISEAADELLNLLAEMLKSFSKEKPKGSCDEKEPVAPQ